MYKMNRRERRSKLVRNVFTLSRYDEAVMSELGFLSEEDPEIILKTFIELKDNLSDPAYWSILTTIWNSYPTLGSSDVWAGLFSVVRDKRRKTLMSTKEFKMWDKLPKEIKLTRNVNGFDILYYMVPEAEQFRPELSTEMIRKEHVVAYFERRKEFLVVNRSKKLQLVTQDEDLGGIVIERNVEHIDLNEPTSIEHG